MSGDLVEYIHLPAGSALPPISQHPRRVLILADQDAEPVWQDALSRWIIASGCLYMMAWGRNCSSWHDSVDHAALGKFDYREIPEDEFVMTTWHDHEPLCIVFFFARACAFHPTIELPLLTIIDIREEARGPAILALQLAESAGLLEDAIEDPRDLPFRQRLRVLLRLN